MVNTLAPFWCASPVDPHVLRVQSGTARCACSHPLKITIFKEILTRIFWTQRIPEIITGDYEKSR